MKTSIAASSLVLVLAAGASAGEIVLKNGSRLSGELASEALLVSTKAGALEVASVQVRVLTPTEIRLRDGRVIQGTVVGQTIKALTPLGELAIKVDELASFRADADSPVPPGPGVAVGPAAPAKTGPAVGPSAGLSTGTLTPLGTSVGPLAGPGPTSSGAPPATAPAATNLPAVVPPATTPVAGAPGPEPVAGGPNQVVTGAKAIGQGVAVTAKGVGRTVVDGADAAHDGIKGFGLKVWDVMRGVGQAFKSAFGS